MKLISVPVDAKLEHMIKHLIASGYSETKAGVVRKALKKAAEDEAVEAVLQGQRDYHEGRVYRGDLRKILKSFNGL